MKARKGKAVSQVITATKFQIVGSRIDKLAHDIVVLRLDMEARFKQPPAAPPKTVKVTKYHNVYSNCDSRGFWISPMLYPTPELAEKDGKRVASFLQVRELTVEVPDES